MQTQTIEKNPNNLGEQIQFQASISPVTNFDHPFIKTNDKDKQQFAAYKNFVKNIEIQHQMKFSNQNSVIDQQILQLQKQFKITKTQIKQKKPPVTNDFKFTQFIEKKQSSRNKIKTASSCTNLRMTKNQHFKISHLPSTAKLSSQGLIKKQNSPQQLKGRPYIDKKPRKQLVLKQHRENSLPKQPKIFHEIKLRVQKLPELKSESLMAKQQIEKPKIQEFKDVEAIIRKKKIQKLKNDLSLSPILKTFDPRYFGLDSKSTNFQKMGQQLLNEIKNKYWCYDNIENQEVYENFEHFLCSYLHK